MNESAWHEPDGTAGPALRECLLAATAAPSIHNTQPWLFHPDGHTIDVLADRRRQLATLDPDAREMFLSIGAALFNLRIAVRAHGRQPQVRLMPDPTQPDLAATVSIDHLAEPVAAARTLAGAIPRRHTNRRPFARAVIPASVLEELVVAARMENATLRVASPVGRGAIFSLVRTAEQQLRSQGVYRAELTEWTLPAPKRRDGVPPHAFGPWDALEALPLRDFGLAVPQLHRRRERFEPFPTIVVLSTAGDTARHWLRAGQALQRVLLAATVHGLAATPMSQPLEIPALRELVTDTATGQQAQAILRLGYAQPTTPTPRRPLAEVLITQKA